jgi:site-specific recombinase XerD
MNLVPIASPTIPVVVAAAGDHARIRFLEFFAANIRNLHTRRAYARAAAEFLAWCADTGVPSIAAVRSVHVATWIEAGTGVLAAPSVKQRLAAIRHLFDWLVTGQVVPMNPTGSVRGPRHVVTRRQTPVLDPSEARAARQDRYLDTCRPARSRADRADGLFLRPHWCRAWHDGRGCLQAEPTAMGAPAREGRQAARDAVPP